MRQQNFVCGSRGRERVQKDDKVREAFIRLETDTCVYTQWNGDERRWMYVARVHEGCQLYPREVLLLRVCMLYPGGRPNNFSSEGCAAKGALPPYPQSSISSWAANKRALLLMFLARIQRHVVVPVEQVEGSILRTPDS